MKMIYSPDRFIMGKTYYSKDLDVMTNYQKMVAFVKESIHDQRQLHWDSDRIKKERATLKIVGEDFDKKVLESK